MRYMKSLGPPRQGEGPETGIDGPAQTGAWPADPQDLSLLQVALQRWSNDTTSNVNFDAAFDSYLEKQIGAVRMITL